MKETKIYETWPLESCLLTCRVTPMGKDYTITICGGSLPHIGSAVMAQARPSLTGNGISATSSVLNCVGHKDETIARMFAEKIAICGNCMAVCICGIHLDNITEKQLDRIRESCDSLLKRILADME